jgi:hypothetical protein
MIIKAAILHSDDYRQDVDGIHAEIELEIHYAF